MLWNCIYLSFEWRIRPLSILNIKFNILNHAQDLLGRRHGSSATALVFSTQIRKRRRKRKRRRRKKRRRNRRIWKTVNQK
jgi:hypothetical protein